MRILGLDLGSPTTKTAASLLDTEATSKRQNRMVDTRPSSFAELMEEWKPDRVVMEATPSTGWAVDEFKAHDVELQVINPRDPAWLNRTVKNDREDAILLTNLSAVGQVRTVVIPDIDVRNWRALITHRQSLVAARTQVKNSIHAILRCHGKAVPHAWTADGMAVLHQIARPFATCTPAELWRGHLDLELRRLADAEKHLKDITSHLDRIGKSNTRVQLLMKNHHGVGPRMAETVVAFIDDPHRFKTGKQVGAYAGLVASVHQSGKTNHTGGITHAGNATLRSLLVEVSWLGICHDGWMRDCYKRIQRGDTKRKHIAIVAVARRLLIRLWATLRDGASKPPPRLIAEVPQFPT